MYLTARQFGYCAALAMVLVAAGCSQEDYGDLGKVTGTVTLDGKPYPNAVVMFSPQKGRPSTAITDDSGSYELTYIRTTKGAEPGEHQVAISTQAPTVDDNYQGPQFKDPIPMRYNRHSELTRTVELGLNEFDFDLKSKQSILNQSRFQTPWHAMSEASFSFLLLGIRMEPNQPVDDGMPMIEEQEPLPDVPEPNEPYRRPVDTMTLPQVEAELRDLFGGAAMYLLIPIFLLSLSTTTLVATPFFVRVLPAAAIVFVGYWVLQKAYGPTFRESPETSLQYLRVVSWLGGGIMSTPHERVLSLCARRARFVEGDLPES